MNNPGWRAIAVLLFCLFSLVACDSWSQSGAKGVGLLAQAPPGETKFSSYQPRNPYAQLAPGIATRTLFETSSDRGYRVEVRDLLVGPGKRTENVSLPGAAVFDIRSGIGVITIGGRPQNLTVGSTFTVADRETFTIENTGGDPIAIRVHLFAAE